MLLRTPKITVPGDFDMHAEALLSGPLSFDRQILSMHADQGVESVSTTTCAIEPGQPSF